ncbi:MAG TPA: hypothetical protein VFE58_04380 [Tepidisphaeraceae bacterium]|jgi:hypothetical protein|nr:hypothetical protein [Tepidisphaeraceae bacterium]
MQHGDITWQPYHEPLSTTLLRTGAIALVVGAVLALRLGGMAYWPIAMLLVLWLSLGGHWIEILFLNFLRPHLPVVYPVQIAVRISIWFLGGIVLVLAMKLTAMTLAQHRPIHWPAWWGAGLAFIGIELIAHLVLQFRRRPNFYNGRG